MDRRLPYIDGLRAMAILSVVAFHAVQHAPHLRDEMWPWLYALLTNSHGVELFFVISGYCLAFPILKRFQNDGIAVLAPARFAAKRLVRVLPPFYIAATLFFIAWALLRMRGIHPPEAMAVDVRVLDVIKHALLLDLRPHWIDGSYWTLPLEVRWYACFPLVMALWLRSRRAFVAVAFLCWAATYGTRFFGADGLTLPAFMSGIAVADAHVRQWRGSRYAGAACIVLFIAAALVGRHGWTNPLWECAMAALVLWAGAGGKLTSLLSHRLFLPVSATSYGIYLVHEPIVAWLDAQISQVMLTPVACVVAAVVAFAIGMVFSLVADRPFAAGRTRQRFVDAWEHGFSRVATLLGIAPVVRLAQPDVATYAAAPVLENGTLPAVKLS